jgi:hypothetical protein
VKDLDQSPPREPSAYTWGRPRVICYPPSGVDVAVALLRASRRRAQLMVWYPLNVGERVTILIRGPGQPRALHVEAIVSECVLRKDGLYQLDVDFQRPLRREDVLGMR